VSRVGGIGCVDKGEGRGCVIVWEKEEGVW
jgi:hypothetical protein